MIVRFKFIADNLEEAIDTCKDDYPEYNIIEIYEDAVICNKKQWISRLKKI